MEIQIRTQEMDEIAQEGVAAHWAYKEGQKINRNDARLFHELKKLVQGMQEVEDPAEFLDTVRGELYDPDIYVLTPTGEVRELPRSASPIDFAYAIHTSVGDRCAGARVNGRIVPLKYELQNGDIVEIITAKEPHPKQAWLQMAKTSRAKAKIRQWLRKEEKARALELGREICERELKSRDTSLKKLVKGGQLRELLTKLRATSLDELLTKVGAGEISIQQIERALLPDELVKEEETNRQEAELREKTATSEAKASKPVPTGRGAVQVDGIDDLLIKISQCCRPVPGDEILGYITTGSGVAVHKAKCPSLFTAEPERLLEVQWSSSAAGQHRAELLLKAHDRRNLLADISSAISGDDANIIEMNSRTRADNIAEFRVVVEVSGLDQLHRLQVHLSQLPSVIEVRRGGRA